MALLVKKILKLNNEVGIILGGFMAASIFNRGDEDITLTQGAGEWTVPPGTIYDFEPIPGNDGWESVSVDASLSGGSIVECTYL